MPTSMKLLDLIERNAEELTQQWIRTIQNDPETPTYHSFEEATLHDRAYNVYRNLGRWISHKTAEKDVAAVYTELGSTRHGEGFALSEVVLALIFSRQILWNKMQDEGLLDNALDLPHRP